MVDVVPRVFGVVVVGFLACVAAGVALAPERTFSFAENRPLAQFPRFSFADWKRAAFQTSLEAALSDQLPAAGAVKRVHAALGRSWLRFAGAWLVSLVPRAAATDPTGVPYRRLHEPVIPIGGNVFALGTGSSDPLVVAEGDPVSARQAMRESAATVAALAAALPDVAFHTFYIETSVDLDYLGGAVTHASVRAFRDSLPETVGFGALTLESTDDLRAWFYRTDHHWNAAGQQAGYERLLAMLTRDGQSLGAPVPTRILSLPLLSFSGSRARFANDLSRREPFDLLVFDLPKHEVWIDRVPGPYGNREVYKKYEERPPAAAFEAGFNHYGHCNGQDYAEVVYRFAENTGKGHLLVLAESYCNPLKPLIASHFETTRYVDLRFYESTFRKPFDLVSYVTEHSVDQVLFIGYHGFFYKLPEWLPGPSASATGAWPGAPARRGATASLALAARTAGT